MILGFDIGNTHICPIIYDNNGKILEKFRIPSKTNLTEDTLYATLKTLCDFKKIDLSDVKDVVYSSVVPHLNNVFDYLAKKYFNCEPYVLNINNIDENLLTFNANTERSLGADRIATILAMKKYMSNKECIIIDFGTATTFEVIKDNKYLGGAILPGIDLSINALFQNTAKLPKVTFEKPNEVLGNTTVTQINIGIYYSNIGAIKELINQYKNIYPDAYVISTGGQGKIITEDLKDFINEYKGNLCEEGIFEFYRYIKSRS
ncbi:type III pantothenate kinase [Streptobacillus moniliformis]|uniref:type III pantothenate kinase n=1 Tax=Streptobacillus moniliformis TaxID=34105 RepID=UPI0007E4572D|nr:type III pantothenate kinase [Streptobacillus moniliformis]